MIQKREALNEARFATIYQALETFKALNGHVNVKQRFVVPLSGPESESWPVALRGFKLGNALCSIRKGAYATHRSSLEAIGVSFSSQEKGDFERTYMSLKTYLDIYGDTYVHRDFVVPHDAEEWPEETWGVKLGKKVDNIRHKRCYQSCPQQRQMLEELGFGAANESRYDRLEFRTIKLALELFKHTKGHLNGKRRSASVDSLSHTQNVCLYTYTHTHTHTSLSLIHSYTVPQRFVVSRSEHHDWPEVTWGARLGMIVMNMKKKGTYANKKHELEAIGLKFPSSSSSSSFSSSSSSSSSSSAAATTA